MDKEKLDEPLYCTNCKAGFTAEDFGGEPYDTQLEDIVDYCCIERLKEELQLLNKTEQMYRDYPESIKKMVPKSCRDVNSDLSCEEISLWTQGDKLLQEFLLTTSFDLERRKDYVKKSIEEERVDPIICPKCKKGIIIFKEGELRNYESKLT